MILDHIGAIMIDPVNNYLIYMILRSLGRIAFILFAYSLVEGFYKTSNLKKYFFRLLFYAMSIEAFIIGRAFLVDDFSLVMKVNVIWPLVFGMLALILLSNKKIYLKLLAMGLVLLAGIINIPYGGYGVLIIIIFGLYQNPVKQFLYIFGLNLLYIEWPIYSILKISQISPRYLGDMSIQWFSLIAFVFIFLYNGKKGKKNIKLFFYIFYPVHLIIIYLINYLIS